MKEREEDGPTRRDGKGGRSRRERRIGRRENGIKVSTVRVEAAREND